MSSIGDWLTGVIGADGGLALVLVVFLVFLVDAMVFPTLPELFIIVAFFYDPTLGFGALLLAAAIIAECSGLVLLYLIVGRIRIPKRIGNAVNKYLNFLVLHDERLLLLNRIAPMIPFSGAVVRIAGWNIRMSVLYVFIGSLLKYGGILLMSDFFHSFYSSNQAQTFTIIFVFAVIAISFILSVIMKKRKGMDKEESAV